MEVFLIVIDSFGVGSAADAEAYGDEGANTAGHIIDFVGRSPWPFLESMGLGDALGSGVNTSSLSLNGMGARLQPMSAGKDTVSGHWELAGIELTKPFKVFPDVSSFPQPFLDQVQDYLGCPVLGNEAASGTEIIGRLGSEHLRTGQPIFYTSADSVIQIATHESRYSREKLYELCQFVRGLADSLSVGRVIARPFDGEPGSFVRTSGRKDFSMLPPVADFLFPSLQSEKVETIGIGKIGDIFSNQGLDKSFPDKGNPACLERLGTVWNEAATGDRFVFVNLVDTDMIFGHRRDPSGYCQAVLEIDHFLADLTSKAEGDKLLLVTADHGCDPTWEGTDHTRECVPLLQWSTNGTSYFPSREYKGLGTCARIVKSAFTGESLLITD